MDVEQIRAMTTADIPAVLKIDSHNPNTSWTGAKLFASLAHHNVGWVLCEGETVTAFILVNYTEPVCDLLLLGVLQEKRRKGLGTRLLEHVITWASEKKAMKVMLEVARSNIVATAFYRQTGFHEVGVRKHYYSAPIEDAIVMSRRLT